MVTLAWHELISWAITLVSMVLLVVEYRRNDAQKNYMVLQGILRACSQRGGFIASTLGKMDATDPVPLSQFRYALESEYANYVQLQEHVMGSMKAQWPHSDLPFDVQGFLHGRGPGDPPTRSGQ